MTEIQRISPVSFKGSPVKTETRDNFEVALEYSGEGDGPCLVDLCHKMRLDLQDKDVAAKKPFGLKLPATPGECVYGNGILANRMNRTQVSLWQLTGEKQEMPDESSYTDVTEATVFLALLGKDIFFILEKLSAMDFSNPAIEAPCLFQGPLAHVPCQVTVLGRDKEDACVILTCSGGYAKDMVHSFMDAGQEYGLTAAGENKFTNLINKHL